MGGGGRGMGRILITSIPQVDVVGWCLLCPIIWHPFVLREK